MKKIFSTCDVSKLLMKVVLVFSILFFTQIVFAQAQSARKALNCSINGIDNTYTFVADNLYKYAPLDITFSISCTGESSYDISCAANDTNCGYKYYLENSNSILSLNFPSNTSPYILNNLSVTISRPGDYKLIVRTYDSAFTVAEREFSAEVLYPLNVSKYTFYPGPCSLLDRDLQSEILRNTARQYFTCSNNSSIAIGGFVDGADFNDVPNLDPIDVEMCQKWIDPLGNGLPAQGAAFCLPAIIHDTDSKILEKNNSCTLGASTNTEVPFAICNPNEAACRVVSSSGNAYCVVQNQSIQLGEECVLGFSSQCINNLQVQAYCAEDFNSRSEDFGKCDNIVSIPTGDKCVGNRDCIDQNNGDQRYQCVRPTGGGGKICQISGVAPGTDDGEDPTNPDEVPKEVSPAAGPCNCGGIRRLCIRNGVFQPDALNSESLSFITNSVNKFEDLTAEEKASAISCYSCIKQGNTWTNSLGCVNTTISGLFTTILRLALGVSGGIVLIRLIVLGYQYAFSKEKMKLEDASKNVVATLGGLLLILFSVVILRIIGVNILDVVPPGFFGT